VHTKKEGERRSSNKPRQLYSDLVFSKDAKNIHWRKDNPLEK
jgi:hypothetical protein